MYYRLSSFLFLWFVCLPSDASPNTYCLTWVSLTLDVGYLFTAAPAKHSCCSLPWTEGYLLLAAAPRPLRPRTWGCSSWLLPLTSGVR